MPLFERRHLCLLLFLTVNISELQFSTSKSIYPDEALDGSESPNESFSVVDQMKIQGPIKGSNWSETLLTYRITKYPHHLHKHEVDSKILDALKLWSDVSFLKFIKKDHGLVHLELSFKVRYHPDNQTSHGPGGHFTHILPAKKGEYMHLDIEEDLNIVQNRALDAHKPGHDLIVAHVKIKKSLLLAVSRKTNDAPLSLDKDDVLVVQAIYGRRENKLEETSTENKSEDIKPFSIRRYKISDLYNYDNMQQLYDSNKQRKMTLLTPTDQTPPTSSTAPPNLCMDSAIDAATTTPDGKTYFFKGDYYWEYLDESIARGYPRRIQDDWPGLPGNLDAALSWKTVTFFFKDTHVWLFKNKSLGYGYPKPIDEEFPGIPNNIDATFVWGKTGKTYFFKGSNYWMYDAEKVTPVDLELYPRPIRNNWKGLPNNMDAVLQWKNENKSYFFKGNKYLRFLDEREEVYNDYPSALYPRSTAEWWFGCGS